MATRTYCDHCGNTVRNPKVLSFGDLNRRLTNEDVGAYHAAQQGGMAAIMQQIKNQQNAGAAPSAPEIPIVNVDLCPQMCPNLDGQG